MQTKNSMQPQEDNLATMHRNAKKRKKRKTSIIAISVSVAVLLTLIFGIRMLRNRVSDQFGSDDESEIEAYTVSAGSISTTVSGSGTLASEGVEDIDVLNSLEIMDVYVEAGDTVEEGDLLATVSSSSLTSAMAQIQEELDTLDEELEEAYDDTVSSTVKTSVSGRVKQINAESGDDVATVMYEHGALVLLSLDGYLAADVASDSLAAGDDVTVALSDGSEIEGSVEKNIDGTATVLVTDNGVPNGDEVTVRDADGNEIGSAVLYIHSQMAITGYAGTVSSIKVSENQSVSGGKTLMTLTDTETSVNYDSMLKERSVLEEQLNELLVIYKESGICAPVSGVVETVTEELETTSSGYMVMGSSDDSVTEEYTALATISPETAMTVTISVDETDILSLSEGQSAAVTVDSIGDESYIGTVTDISTAATSSSGVSVYSAVVTLDKVEGMLSGMSADVVITIEGVDDALIIPVEALNQTRASVFVYTEYDEETGEFSGMTEVTTGISNSSYVEITSGLSAGDVVYYNPSEETFSFMGFGGFGGMGGMGGSESDMPDFEGMEMPSGGGMPGGDMQGDGMRGGAMPGGN